jgi:hypothetical protein
VYHQNVLNYPNDPQLSAMPFASPTNCENHLAQIVTTLQRLAPVLSERECLRLLGELALVRACLEKIELAARSRVAAQAQRLGLSA